MKITELTENQCIHCPTEDEAKKLCKIMHDAGMKWCSHQTYLRENNWGEYKDETVYIVKSGSYADLDYVKKGYQILTLKDIDEAQENQNPPAKIEPQEINVVPDVCVKTVTTYEIFGREFSKRMDAEEFRDKVMAFSKTKNLQEIADML